MKAHFMLGRVNVDIHLMRIDLQIEHVSGLLVILKLGLESLADSVINQLVAHHPAIDVAIL